LAIRADDVDLGRDRALVERFQAGDSDAFGELYGRYHQRLERFCLKRVGDPHDAEEVAQEAFTRALRAMSRLEGERRFYPWVSVIAARLCMDHHRRRARTEPSSTVDLGVIEGGQEDVADAADADLVVRAFERLGPRHREVLQLREMDGWSYQHIADHYQVSLGTVEALLFRARRALRREFETLNGGRLATLPVLGWLGSRLHQLRSRIQAALPNLTPLVANTLGAVFVVSSLVGLSGLGGSSSQRLTTGPVGPAGPLAGPFAGTGAPRVVFHPAGAAPAQPAATATQPAARAGRLGPLRVESAAAAQAEIAKQPIHIITPPVAVGVDPSAAVHLVVTSVRQVGHQVGVPGS
jgi:RNA polymerase sigma-70 factor (ECF subfamily)